MAQARPIEGLRPETPMHVAAARIIEVRSHEVFAQRDGVLDPEEIEAVHAMRVATRRLRAALEFFAPCFPRRPYRRALREVKDLADALGARRDPDVQIAGLRELRAAGHPRNRRAIDGLIERLTEEQRAANEALTGALEHVRDTDLAAQLTSLARSAR